MPVSITLFLIIITVIASLYAWQNRNLMENWVNHPVSVMQGREWWRLLTSGLLHADFMHLFFNMFALYSFGQVVETIFLQVFGLGLGIALYLAIYIGAIIISDILTLFKHKNDSRYYSLGASGGVSAIVFASIYFNPLGELTIFIPIPITLKGYIFGAIYLMYSYYLSKKGNDGINHSAHFYGAAFGFVISILLVPAQILGFIQAVFGG